MRLALGLILLAALGSPLRGATINAATASRADVGTAYASCVDGDTLKIPDGNVDWTTTLVITNAIILQGNGTGSTIISNSAPVGQPLMHWYLVANKNSRMTAIEFRPGSVGYNVQQMLVVDGVNIDARRMRTDHCKFDTLNSGVWLFWTTLGVFDHNTVITDGSVPAWGGYCKGNSWGGTQTVNTYGDGSYALGEQFGSDQFMVFEDNLFTNKSTTAHVTLMDSQAGARYVFRHNKVYKGSLESHGLEASRERSGRAFEIYCNTFDGIDTQDFIIYFRGGNGLCWSNYVFGYSTTPTIHILNNRLADAVAEPFGGADGHNPWDTNNPANPLATGTCTSAGTLSMTDSGKSWTPHQWKGYALRKTSGKAVSSMSRSGASSPYTITVNCTAHGFTNGEYVSVFQQPMSVNSEQPYNVTVQITFISANQFSYTTQFAPPTPATAAYVACAGNYFSEILDNTGNTLTFKASLYDFLGISMSFLDLGTYEINEIIRAMDEPGLGVGADLAGADTPSVIANYAGAQAIIGWWSWTNVVVASGPAALGAAGNPILISPVPLRLLVDGVEYHNNASLPNYTSLAYPHPLVAGGGVSEWNSGPPGASSVSLGKGTLQVGKGTISISR